MSATAVPEVVLQPGQEAHGFRVQRVTPLPGLRAVAYELEHRASGAHVLHVHCGDAENLLSINFRTPPPDDTGLPHILEHSVLGGSRKYPVKEPFIEMLKASMATFINAMTGGDATYYPIASNVKQDFYNLAEVYCDAVFHPRLSLATFQQEGHHLEFAKPGETQSGLLVKGVVYNEMKGAYSAAESRAWRLTEQHLFPDSPYGRDAGGDPQRIPELTYAAFKRFHRDLYHPSNAYIFLYGDIPPQEQLAFLKHQLVGFRRRKVEIVLPRQPRWSAPREVAATYPVNPGDPVQGKSILIQAWLAGDGLDPLEVLACMTLNEILVGDHAAPLRKALVDSKLGEDLTNTGYHADGVDTFFTVGLKGSEGERKEAFGKLVAETLTRLAEDGLPAEQVESALHQVAIQTLEIETAYPLHLLFRGAGFWLNGGEPLAFLRADELLADLRRRYAADPKLFDRLIRKFLLDNRHRLTLVVTPDREMQAREDAAFAAQMAARKKKLKPERLAQIAQEAAELDRFQSAPNSPEALATLPQLKVRDLPPHPRHIPTAVEQVGERLEFLRNDVFANGVNYLELDLDLAGLPEELYLYLPLYADAFHKMGAAGMDYVRIAQRRTAHTGELSFWTAFRRHATDTSACLRRARFRVKFLDAKTGPALDLLRDLFFEPDFRDVARLQDVVVQTKARHRTMLTSNALTYARCHAARALSREAWLNELHSGVPQARLAGELAAQFDARRDELIGKLEAIRAYLLGRGRLTASFTGSASVEDAVRRSVAEWAGRLRGEPAGAHAIPPLPPAEPRRVGLAVPAQVAFCAQALPAPHWSHPDTPLLEVAGWRLSFGYMHDEVRAKGGAYGTGCWPQRTQGIWSFYSFRDPWVKRTLDVFNGLAAYVRRADLSQADVDRAIIGTAKEAEQPIRPGAATGQALSRHVDGETREVRERRHEALLGATAAEVKRAVLAVLEQNAGQAAVCVATHRAKLEAANQEMPDAPLVIEEVTL